MEQQNYPITTMPPAVATDHATPPTPTPTPSPTPTPTPSTPRTPPVTWRLILICLVVSAASAVISSYLTIERVSPRMRSQDSSQAAQEAEALRNDWRQQYEQSIAERSALEAKVEKLNAQVDKLAKAIKQTETLLAATQAKTTTYAEIKETLNHATKTDDGLRAEASRIIGDLGVSRIRIRE